LWLQEYSDDEQEMAAKVRSRPCQRTFALTLTYAVQASKKQDAAKRKLPAGGSDAPPSGGRRGGVKTAGDVPVPKGHAQPAAHMHSQQHFRPQHHSLAAASQQQQQQQHPHHHQQHMHQQIRPQHLHPQQHAFFQQQQQQQQQHAYVPNQPWQQPPHMLHPQQLLRPPFAVPPGFMLTPIPGFSLQAQATHTAMPPGHSPHPSHQLHMHHMQHPAQLQSQQQQMHHVAASFPAPGAHPVHQPHLFGMQQQDTKR
jgi:hypothetical protein